LVASLDGKVVAYLEARMLSEMGALITRHGGVPYAAPVLQEVYATDTPEVAALVDDLCGDKLDVVVLQTGVGTRALFEAAANRGVEQELLAALSRITVIARSPKPAAVLRKSKVRIDLMPPEPFTSEDLIVAIQDMDFQQKEVAVQAYGGPNNLLTKTLKERGANVREVSLYTWGLPEDQSPVLALVDKLAAGEIAAVAFTSQPQVGNLAAIAAQAGKEEVLRQALNSESVVVASVGPVCTRRLKEEKIKVDVEPDHPHMGNLVIALAEYFQTNEAESGVNPG
jgi:uroporphyrinogen-III synthase